MKIQINDTVFPSEDRTINVISNDAEMEVGYENACHKYEAKNCLGFKDGNTEYTDEVQTIQFVEKHKDGTITPGLQSEQLAIILLHRVNTMNRLFPCPENEKQIEGLNMFLNACKDRVQNRIDRGVMGDLKK